MAVAQCNCTRSISTAVSEQLQSPADHFSLLLPEGSVSTVLTTHRPWTPTTLRDKSLFHVFTLSLDLLVVLECIPEPATLPSSAGVPVIFGVLTTDNLEQVRVGGQDQAATNRHEIRRRVQGRRV